MNIFIEHIYNKTRFNVFNYIKYRRFLRKLDKVNPNFGMLWQIADFIKILEQVYMYDNSSTNTLYSSLKFEEGENGFILNTNEASIRFKLYQENETIGMEIIRNKGNKLKSSMRFNENSLIDNIHDAQLMINIIDWLMDAVKQLLIIYYKKK